MHYQRAYVDRTATRDGEPIRFIAATEGRKGDGIDLRMTGARLDRFRANPVFGYGHRYGGRDDLPIGRATRAEVDGDRLLVDVEFDQGDEFARQVERKYRDGFMNAVSIGFEVTEWEGSGSHWSGGVAQAWELHELSAVPIPMDAGAVVAGGRSADALDTADRALLRALVAEFGQEPVMSAIRKRLLGLPVPEAEQAPQPSVPSSGVDATAAQAVLAAFTVEGTS
jgi:hypothetical protein